MATQKQSVSFTEPAFAFAKELVDSGEYPNVSAAVSGELVRAKEARARERALFEAELARRLELPLEEWIPLEPGERITDGVRARLAEMRKAASRSE